MVVVVKISAEQHEFKGLCHAVYLQKNYTVFLVLPNYLSAKAGLARKVMLVTKPGED